MQVPLPATIAALKLAKSKGVFTIFNPAPAQKSLPDEIYGLCDIFCPNETETEILTGIEVKDVDDAKKAAQVLLNKGAKSVLITLGERGSVWITNGQEPKHVPAEKVEKVNVRKNRFRFLI
jgi:ribokinase